MLKIRKIISAALLLMLMQLVLVSDIVAQSSGVNPAQREKMNAALEIIKRMYVDDLDDEELVEQAIEGIIRELDPHSSYLSAERLKEATQPLIGNFEGIGVEFNILNDTILVVSTISGGPSERVGIQAGDKIIKIDGENVAGTGITNTGVRNRLLGERGTKVEVSIARAGSRQLLDFTITRDRIPIYSLDASYMVTPDIGYIKLNRFSATTVREFKDALKDLQGKGMQSLILDLRGNGGGYLEAAYELADEFLERNKLVVYYEGNASPRLDRKSTSAGGFKKGKLVVLIDEGSASASEIVSGAVQDWDRGLVIGRRSFGKGLVQRDFPLPDGAAVRLTVARYFTPSGRSIQKPYEDGLEAYQREIMERFATGEVYEDLNNVPDSLIYKTAGGRKVYGGGGVFPDIFMPLDTAHMTDYYRAVVGRGFLNQFALSYVDQNRSALNKKYSNALEFNAQVDNRELMNEFIEFAEKRGVQFDEEGMERSYDVLNNQVKAFIARNLWNTTAYFQILNSENQTFNKALEVIQNEVAFEELKVTR